MNDNSQREQALNEVITMLDEHIASLRDEELKKKVDNKISIDLITDIRCRVGSISNGTKKKFGKHYIRLMKDNTYNYCCSNTIENIDTSDVLHIYGPFQSKEGAEYRINHPKMLKEYRPIF